MESKRFGVISKIAYGPIKGVGQIEVASAKVTPQGISGDKEYAIVQAEPNAEGVHRWVSQRDKRNDKDKSQSLGVLALIWPSVVDNLLKITWQGADEIDIPNDRNEGRELAIQIWNDVITGTIDQGDQIAEWLSDHLQYSVRLVKAPQTAKRTVSQKWYPNSNKLNFQDSYPLNWFTQNSLDELNRRIPEGTIDWTRFRPNIVVSDASHPDAEHEYLSGRFGNVPVINAKPCDRCPVPLVDQTTGQKVNGEPLRTLNKYKRWQKPDGKVFVILGEGALPQEDGEISVGDEVTMTERRSERIVYGGVEIKPRKQ